MRQNDVCSEQRSVGECERDPDWLSNKSHVGQQVDASSCRRCGGEVAPNPCSDQGEGDWSNELDCCHRRQRQPVDRDVEARVHDRKDRAESDRQQLAGAVEGEKLAPGPPPHRKDHGRRSDSKPSDPQDINPGEEEHCERWPQVMEDGAAYEIRVWR